MLHLISMYRALNSLSSRNVSYSNGGIDALIGVTALASHVAHRCRHGWRSSFIGGAPSSATRKRGMSAHHGALIA